MKTKTKIVSIISLGILTISGLVVASNQNLLNMFDFKNQIEQKKGKESKTFFINPGDSQVISFAQKIKSINFSLDSGFTIRTLEGGTWKDASGKIEDFQPLKGYLVRNFSKKPLIIKANYAPVTKMEDAFFSRELKAGWNMVAPAYKNDLCRAVTINNGLGDSLPYSSILDVTGIAFQNVKNSKDDNGDFCTLLRQLDPSSTCYSNTKKIKIVKKFYSGENHFEAIVDDVEDLDIVNKNGNFAIKSKNDAKNNFMYENLAYPIFVNNDTLISGSQNITDSQGREILKNKELPIVAVILNNNEKVINTSDKKIIIPFQLISTLYPNNESINALVYNLKFNYNNGIKESYIKIGDKKFYDGVINKEIKNGILFGELHIILKDDADSDIFDINFYKDDSLILDTTTGLSFCGRENIISNMEDIRINYKKEVTNSCASLGKYTDYTKNTQCCNGLTGVIPKGAGGSMVGGEMQCLKIDDGICNNQYEDKNNSPLDCKSETVVVSIPLSNIKAVRGEINVEFMNLDIKAQGKFDIVLDEIIFKIKSMSGTVVDNSNISKVSLYSGFNLIKEISGSQINKNFAIADFTGTKSFKNVGLFSGIDVNILKNTTEILRIKVDLTDSSEAVTNSPYEIEIVSLTINDENGNKVKVNNLPLKSSRQLSVVDSGKLNIVYDSSNEDNNSPKTILAGDEKIVASVDVKATNEYVDIEIVKFIVDKDLTRAISSASLYLDDGLIATSTSSDINYGTIGTIISFDNLTNLIIPEETVELRLELKTNNIGYQKVGGDVLNAKIIKVDLLNLEGINSGKTLLDIDTGMFSSKDFSIVPAIVIPSIINTLSTNGEAKIRVTADSGDNKQKNSNASPVVNVKEFVFTELGNSEEIDSYSIYKDGNSASTKNCVTSDNRVICTLLNPVSIDGYEDFIIKAKGTINKTYNLQLQKTGVIYSTSETDDNDNGSVEFTSNINQELNLGNFIGENSVGNENNIDKDEIIKNSFNEVYNHYKKEIPKKLKKDSNGYSDTYVLYDFQTHMQTSLIYADEKGNKEMLAKLLELALIPLQDKYLTNGKWLNNNNGYVGKEVNLPISQYFSLLTRVISAGERHGINVNLSDGDLKIIEDHIDKWIKIEVNRDRIDDKDMFYVQSILQFYDYMNKNGKTIKNIIEWKKYVQDYMNLSVNPKWEKVECSYNNEEYNCLALDRTGWGDYIDYAYAGYGKDYKKINSDTDPKAMFDSNGVVKHPKKYLDKVATDISHARRFNWFFETVYRFGKPFDVTISNNTLQGWANNLAYRVSIGTIEYPHFTVFSDGVNGWYRVNYNGTKGAGLAPGYVDKYFVGSSYGIMGIYNEKIYRWMNAWVNKYGIEGVYKTDKLNYYSSIEINIKNSLTNISSEKIVNFLEIGNIGINTTQREYSKDSILAGETQEIFNVVIEGQNEDIEVGALSFKLLGGDGSTNEDLKNTINKFFVYLDDTQIFEGTSSSIVVENGTLSLKVENSFILKKGKQKLRLVIETNNIGYQNVGKAIYYASMKEFGFYKLRGIESDASLDSVVQIDNFTRYQFFVTPAKITTSVINTLANNGEAKIKLSVNTGYNKELNTNASTAVYIKGFSLKELGNSNEIDSYFVYKDGDSASTKKCNTFFNGDFIYCELKNPVHISGFENFIIKSKATVNKTYALELNGIDYVTTSGSTNLNSSIKLDLGSKTY